MHGPDIATISLVTMTVAIAIFGASAVMGDRERRRLNWGLALFLGIAAFDTWAVLIDLWHASERFHWVGAMEPFVTMLYGPAIYLYVLHVTGKPPTRRRRALLFGGPGLVGAILFIAAALFPRDVRLAMVAGAPIPDPALAGGAEAIMTAMQISFVIVTLGFLVACWRALDENLRRIDALFSSIEDRTLNWLRVVMILICLAWVQAALQPLLAGFRLGGGWIEAVDAGITLTWVSLLAYFGIRQRPALQEPEPEPQAPSAPPVEETPEKYARSALDDDRMRQLGERLTRLMRSEALHRDSSLSLRRLADRVGASPNYVSQTLNHHLGVSFFDFVNDYRVDEAERLMRTTDRTITDIALEVGFNSRSTFNAAVRKHRGVSPSELRQG